MDGEYSDDDSSNTDHTKTSSDRKTKYTHDHDHSIKIKFAKEKDMYAQAAVPALVAGGTNDGLGGGLGAILAASLLTRRNEGDTHCDAAKVALSNAGFDGINHNINTSMIGLTNQLSTGFGGQRDLGITAQLGSIQGAIRGVEGEVWKAEGQAQLAIAGAVSEINSRIADGLTTAIAGQGLINKNISDAIATSLASQNSIKEAIAAYGVANLTATKDSQYAVTTAVRDDGDKTRALISRQYEDTLNRELIIAREALADQRSAARSRDVEVNVSQTVNQNQAQAQLQTQQQQQFQILAQLSANLNNLANDIQVVRQTQSNINFGVQAGVGQSANATNNRVS